MPSVDRSILSLILLLTVLCTQTYSLPYDVHWLGGPTSIERDSPATQKSIDIYCYTGTSKNIIALWQTVKFHIRIKNEEFRHYMGPSPGEVYKEYTEDSYGWSVVNPFQKKQHKSNTIDIFTPTCMIVNTKEKHGIDLQVQRVDIWRVLLMFLGISIIFSSKTLSSNPLFFYLCGILVGVFASFMVLVYYISKLLPRKTFTYGVLIGGWTVGVYIFQQLWENIRSVVLSYQNYVFWYTLLVSLASFMLCYRIGPPTDRRSQNLVMWTLQTIGVLMIFFSSEYQEASAAIILVSMIAKYFPNSWLRAIYGYWRRRFPPARRLLSSEQYYEQGARETKRALEELRKYCSSPDCAQWRVMLKLNDSKRFASFVEGDSHLSDDEVLNYESYAIAPWERENKSHSLTREPRRLMTHEISEDEEDSDDSDD